MPLGKAREPRGVGTTGPGLMQEVKEEKSGEAGKEATEKADGGLVGAEETARSFHQKKETEKQPSSPPPALRSARCPRGAVVRGPVAVRVLPHRPLTANQSLLGRPRWGAPSPARASVPRPAHPATLTRSLTSPRPPCPP